MVINILQQRHAANFRGAAFVAAHAVTIWINLFPIDPQSIKKMVNPNVKILWKNSHQWFFLRIGLKPKHRKFSLNQKIYNGTEYDVAVSKQCSFKRI